MADKPESRAEYKHTPIEARSIRLLHLHPAISFNKSPIEVSLHEFPIGACPDFGALSYTWATEDGDSSLSECLQCDGAIINVTRNCDAALRRLRQTEQVRVLWVDAVCIDQSNDDERSLQIALMRQIYTQAAWVGFWVGEASSTVDQETGTPLSDLGMAFIHDFAVEIAERSNSGKDVSEGALYQEFVKDRRAFQHSGVEAFTPRVRGLWDILHRQWWARLWVVQEVALSQSSVLICGGKSEAFHNLTVVINALVRNGQPAEVFEFNAFFVASAFHQFNMRNFVRTGQLGGESSNASIPRKKALEILNATRNTHASDPRDKIYGILGFFEGPESDPENILPPPDYKRTAAEVYADVSRAIITSTGNLDVLSSCYGYFRSTVPDLPSWVAAWNDTPVKFFDDGCFNAASGSSVICEESGDNRLLRIKGRRIDSVKDVSQLPETLHYTNEACTEIWRHWCDFAFSLQSYPTGEMVADVFKDTLCWGNNLKHDRLAPGEYQETFDAWIKILRGAEDVEVVAKDIFQDKVAFTYSHRVSFVTWARTLGTTEKSYLAMLPVTASVGDEIVIFNGGKVPYAIRPEGGKSKLVGPCYVHGIMDGESCAKGGLASDELEWFTLC